VVIALLGGGELRVPLADLTPGLLGAVLTAIRLYADADTRFAAQLMCQAQL
jgi:hypothetical protein